MKKPKNHLHAWSLYEEINWKHFVFLFVSVVWAKITCSKSVNVHLPLELQHPKVFKKLQLANSFVKFGQSLKTIFNIPLFWENAPLLNYGKWNLKYGQTNWTLVPKNIDLCLDTGHLILGAKNISEARLRITTLLEARGAQIKHLHIHENDFVSDQHKRPKIVLTDKILKILKAGRTYIYEK